MKMVAPFIGFSSLPYLPNGKGGSIAQFFGEHPEIYSQTCYPGDGCLTGGHDGWDCLASWGTPIVSVTDGIVVDVVDSNEGHGRTVRILCDDGVEEPAEWAYAHFARIDITIGQKVAAGYQIGLMGNSGFVINGPTPLWKFNPYQGTHLHIAKRPLARVLAGESWDRTYLDNTLHYRMAQPKNGYLGAVNPAELLQFTADVPALLMEKLSEQIRRIADVTGTTRLFSIANLLESINL